MRNPKDMVGGISVRVLEQLGEAMALSEFAEGKHPRAGDGKFTEGEGGEKPDGGEKKESSWWQKFKAKAKAVDKWANTPISGPSAKKPATGKVPNPLKVHPNPAVRAIAKHFADEPVEPEIPVESQSPVLLDDFEAQHPRGAGGRFIEGDGDPETRAEERASRTADPAHILAERARNASKMADDVGTFVSHAHAGVLHEDARTSYLIRANQARKDRDQQAERDNLRLMEQHHAEATRHNLILRRMSTGGRRA